MTTFNYIKFLMHPTFDNKIVADNLTIDELATLGDDGLQVSLTGSSLGDPRFRNSSCNGLRSCCAAMGMSLSRSEADNHHIWNSK
jgi:hypothetical protein